MLRLPRALEPVHPVEPVLYRWIGVSLVKRIVANEVWPRVHGFKPAAKPKKCEEFLNHVELETKAAEACHAATFVLASCIALYYVETDRTSVAVWITGFNVALNAYPVMLQRSNRRRMQHARLTTRRRPSPPDFLSSTSSDNGVRIWRVVAPWGVYHWMIQRTGTPMLRLTHARIALAALGIVFITSADAIPANTAPSSPNCAAAGYRQLDFWIGDWDTFETDTHGGPLIARARVTLIAEGCAIHELYEQTDGLIGDSILSYDPARKQWQQTWVTNRGSLMVLWGTFADGALVLTGESHLRDGTSVMQRITWKTQDEGVRESAVQSKDGGKTWTPAFDVIFLKRKEG